MYKLYRITTVPLSLETLLKGQLRYMSQYYHITAISSDKPKLEKVGKTEGVHTFSVELTRQITLWQDLKALWELYCYFKKEKPEIVHTHTPKAGLIGMLAAYLAKVPHRLHTVAGMPLMEATGLKRTILNCTEELTYSCATKVYPNAIGLETFIIKHKFCNPDKLKIIAGGSSNGIDTQHFCRTSLPDGIVDSLKQELQIHQEDTTFCFVGRLVKDKGINELVKAFVSLNKKYPQTKLLLVGPFERELDPLNAETEKLISNHPAIIHTGYQQDVRPYLAIADIFVFPSYREGFPNVVMQAGAMDLPSIVTDINGCNEIIQQDINGLIIPPKDASALYNAMELLLIDKNKRNAMAAVSRQMIANRYEQFYVWQELLKEYQSL